MELSDSQIEQIAAKVAEKLQPDNHSHTGRHVEHHDWVEQRIKDQADLRKFRKKIIESATIWAVMGVLGFFAYSCWKTVLALVKTGGLGS